MSAATTLVVVPSAGGPRASGQRKADTLEKLEAIGADVWVASASATGVAHLVPLSYAWDGTDVIVALERRSLTARNIEQVRHARLGLGETRDVVMIDVELVETVDTERTGIDLADGYAAQAGWDPRAAGPGNVFLRLRPQRIQAWREADELAGRTLMRDGSWLV